MTITDAPGGGVCFTAKKTDKNIGIWPICHIPNDLKEAASLRFDIQCTAEGGATPKSGVLFLPKKADGTSANPSFKLPPAGEWSTVTVPFNRDDMDKVHYFQLMIHSSAESLTVCVRNFAFLKRDGSLLELRPTVAKPAPQKAKKADPLKALGAPFTYSAVPGETKAYLSETTLPDGTKCPWHLVGYTGKKIGPHGVATVTNGKLEVKLTLPLGFYELVFPEQDRTFGISVLPAYQGKNDPFFSIEALLEIRNTRSFTASCSSYLQKAGILFNRELATGDDGTEKYAKRRDSLYEDLLPKGIKTVAFFGDFTAKHEVFFTEGHRMMPARILGLDDDVRGHIEKRRDLAGFQMLNEYDLQPTPAESCMPAIKATAWAMRDLPDVLCLAPAFCKGSTPSTRDAIKGGMLDMVDVYCFHTYEEPEKILPLYREYREDMKGHPKANLPIWITETGKPWRRQVPATKTSPARTNLHPECSEDLSCALYITMKAVEAKACGVQRYFPFTMGYFEETVNNFGMSDNWGTPLRSLHCYAYATLLLSNLEYVGDWKNTPSGLQPVRVFSDGKQAVAVFYAGKLAHDKTTTVSLKDFPKNNARCISIEGSELKLAADKLTFDGGMAYLAFPASALSARMINTNTETYKLYQSAKSYKAVSRQFTPVVFRYESQKAAGRSSGGYNQPKDGIFQFRITNLDTRERTITPELVLPKDITCLTDIPKNMKLAPRSEAFIDVKIQNTAMVHYDIHFGAKEYPLSTTIVPVLDLSNMKPITLDFMNVNRWHQNSSGTQYYTYDEKEQAIDVVTDFSKHPLGDTVPGGWSFPEYRFTDAEKRPHLLAVSFDYRYDNKGLEVKPHLPLLMLSFNDKSYESYSINSPNATWKHYMILIGDNDRAYDLIRIGMCSHEDDLHFQFRNVQLWY